MQNHCRRLEPWVVEHELFTWKNGALGVDGHFDEEARSMVVGPYDSIIHLRVQLATCRFPIPGLSLLESRKPPRTRSLIKRLNGQLRDDLLDSEVFVFRRIC